jgi:DegV family protein with EDD domain
VDTLEHLRRGGRIGSAAALVGSALAVKPVLHVVDGQVVALEKVRTSTRALNRIVQRAADVAGNHPVGVAVHHLAAPERAQRLTEQLIARLADVRELHVSELGAAVGAHVGPGAVGVVIDPSSGWGGPSPDEQVPLRDREAESSADDHGEGPARGDRQD